MPDDFLISEDWRSEYPGAAIGVLVMRDVTNPREHAELEARKDLLVDELRSKFSSYDREALKEHPVLASYRAYYKSFKKTYQVQHQLESVVHKGKSIPKVAALVEAMFMAELKNLLLTAGHDMDQVRPPVTIDLASGDESFIRLNGQEGGTKPKDMLIADREGILSCILYGPAKRASIEQATKRVLFTVYAPHGIDIEAVNAHLEDIRNNVLIVAPAGEVEVFQTLSAD